MTLVFFYGTLMTPFDRAARLHITSQLVFKGWGTVAAALYDLGDYPAAVPGADGRVRGEVHVVTDPAVLRVLDAFEGYREDAPASSGYTRQLLPVRMDDDAVVEAFAYVHRVPPRHAPRIDSGDYLAYVRTR